MFRILRDLVFIALVLGGVLGASQVPRFVQEYEQRLGGARDEVVRLLGEFSNIAAGSGESLSAYADRLAQNSDKSIAATGARILNLAERERALSTHARELAGSARLLKPVVLVQGGDRAIMAATWDAYGYTLTLDPEYGGIGLVLGWLVHALLAAIAGLFAPRRRPYRPRRN